MRDVVLAEVAAEVGVEYQPATELPTYAVVTCSARENASYARSIRQRLDAATGDNYKNIQTERVKTLKDDLATTVARAGYQMVGLPMLVEDGAGPGCLRLSAAAERLDGSRITRAELPADENLGWLAECGHCGWFGESTATEEAAWAKLRAHSCRVTRRPWWKRRRHDV